VCLGLRGMLMGSGGAVRPLRRLFVVALIVFAALVSAAGAKTIKPNKTSDHAPNGCTKRDCTLREAIDKANSTPEKDAIKLKGGKIYKLKQAGADEDMNATGDLDILAPLKISAKGKRATVNGRRIDRVFHIPAMGGATKLVNLVIAHGEPGADGNPAASGGGVEIDGPGTTTLVKSVVTKNDASLSGGGINVSSTAGGVKVSRSTITGNTAGSGGGVDSDAETTIVGSTVAHNKSTGTAGGLKTHQGLTVRNSTIYANRADGDGGGLSALSTTTLNNVTIARNKSTTTGGGISSSGTTTISNSLIALNKLTGMMTAGVDCAGAFMSAGHNLRGTDEMGCTGFTGEGDIVKANPRLGKLASNGGPTATVALKKGSPAIGAGGDDSEPRDQRGRKRDNHPDIGAFER
jgi:hypothetical protein